MEVHANLFEYFDVSDDNSELLFIATASFDFLKNEELIGLSSFFDKLFTTYDSEVLFVLALLDGQYLCNFTSLRLKE